MGDKQLEQRRFALALVKLEKRLGGRCIDCAAHLSQRRLLCCSPSASLQHCWSRSLFLVALRPESVTMATERIQTLLFWNTLLTIFKYVVYVFVDTVASFGCYVFALCLFRCVLLGETSHRQQLPDCQLARQKK